VTATSSGQPLYAYPPQRQPLTLNQLREHWQVAKVLDMTDAEIDFADYVLIVRDVEALHGINEKNTEQDGNCKHCVNGCPACDARRQPNVLL
jgi:hypothetical protein